MICFGIFLFCVAQREEKESEGNISGQSVDALFLPLHFRHSHCKLNYDYILYEVLYVCMYTDYPVKLCSNIYLVVWRYSLDCGGKSLVVNAETAFQYILW